ncbi:MAG TPA: membrane dipeptidase [Chitinophagaceae bacterium]|nr:membrane dipeptidase [Chitinophagaceae bacterium]
MIVDLHLDLAMNAMEWNRDLRLPVSVINAREEGKTDKPDRGNATVSLDALRKGGVGLLVATQIGRYVAPGSHLQGWASPEQAWAQTQAQLAWYRVMEAQGEMKQITDRQDLEEHLVYWEEGYESGERREEGGDMRKSIGYILSLEGADSLIDLSYLDIAYSYGLRAIGPAHYGPGRYANGTNATGKMGRAGMDLLKRMDELKMILDCTHLCDDAFWQALDLFKGPVWASHNNCRSIVDHNRQFDDDQIKLLISREALIGAAFDAWMIVPGWERGKSTPENMHCNIGKLIDHIDHICQIAGNSLHVSIGSDLDGGYGREQCPYDLETIADLAYMPGLFSLRGYSEQDIDNIMQANALRFLRKNLQDYQD